MARTIARQIVFERGESDGVGRARLRLPDVAADVLRADDTDRVYFRVLGPRGEHLAGDTELAAPDDSPALQELRLRDDEIHSEPVRIAYLWVAGASADAPSLVQVAETLGKRARLATEIIKGVIIPQFVILPLAAAGVAGPGARHQALVACWRSAARAAQGDPSLTQDGAAGGGAAGVRSTTAARLKIDRRKALPADARTSRLSGGSAHAGGRRSARERRGTETSSSRSAAQHSGRREPAAVPPRAGGSGHHCPAPRWPSLPAEAVQDSESRAAWTSTSTWGTTARPARRGAAAENLPCSRR
jgi:hypothetical protein